MDSYRQPNTVSGNTRPSYSLIFRNTENSEELISGEALQRVTGTAWADFRYANNDNSYSGSRPMLLVYAEDSTYYYGVAMGYQDNSGFNARTIKIKKNNFDLYVEGEQYHRIPRISNFRETIIDYSHHTTPLKNYDALADISCPNSYNYLVFGDYTTTRMFGDFKTAYPTMQFEDPYLYLGLDFTLEYNDSYETVAVYATVDFSQIGKDNSVAPPLQATTRKVWIGTFPLQEEGAEERTKIFGIWNGDRTWLESVQFEYVPETEQTCDHIFIEKITREGTCTHDEIIRYTCYFCGEQHEEAKHAVGHEFLDYRRPSDGKTIRKCTECRFTYVTDEPVKNEGDESFFDSVISKPVRTETDGNRGAECNTKSTK